MRLGSSSDSIIEATAPVSAGPRSSARTRAASHPGLATVSVFSSATYSPRAVRMPVFTAAANPVFRARAINRRTSPATPGARTAPVTSLRHSARAVSMTSAEVANRWT